jgi:hypothetical protein
LGRIGLDTPFVSPFRGKEDSMRRSFLLALVLGLALAALIAVPATATSRVFVTHLSGDEEVPPRDTRAQGQAIFKLSKDGQSLDYRLIVANIENVVAAHIHVAPVGVNGPIVVPLYGPAQPGGGRTSGVLATGTITAADLTGPLAGQPLSALIAQIEAGNAYVNVHTDDGVAPPDTGPGDFPGGEIRGQL